MLPGKAKENKMKNQKTITTHTYTCWRRQRRSSRSSMVFIAIVVVDVYGRDCRYFVIYLYCTHKVRHGHEHTHTHTRVHQNQHPNVIWDFWFRFQFDPSQRHSGRIYINTVNIYLQIKFSIAFFAVHRAKDLKFFKFITNIHSRFVFVVLFHSTASKSTKSSDKTNCTTRTINDECAQQTNEQANKLKTHEVKQEYENVWVCVRDGETGPAMRNYRQSASANRIIWRQ